MPDGDPSGVRVSVVIPARNEESRIGETVERFLASDYPDFEVIVVDDQSTDRTGEILREAAGRDPCLRVITGQPLPAGWLGKPWALQQGGEAASGEWILFCDADVEYEGSALGAIVALAERSHADVLAALPEIRMIGFWEHVLMSMLVWVGLVMAPLWLSNLTKSRLLGVGGGTGILVRREAWTSIGGHRELRSAVVDDVSLMRRLRAAGMSSLVVRAEGFVSIRMYRGGREIVEGFTKNFYYVLGRSVPVALTTLLASVAFHLLPWWWGLAGLLSWSMTGSFGPTGVAGGLSVAAIMTSRVAILRQLGGRLDNALLGAPIMLAGWSVIAIRSIWLVGIRRRLMWRGREYDGDSAGFGA